MSERITDAPVEFRSLGRRVAAGRLTWSDFWASPGDHDGGHDLLRAVMRAQLDSLHAVTQEAAERAAGEPDPR